MKATFPCAKYDIRYKRYVPYMKMLSFLDADSEILIYSNTNKLRDCNSILIGNITKIIKRQYYRQDKGSIRA